MIKTHQFSFSVLFALVLAAGLIGGALFVSAHTEHGLEDIQFPVQALGGCADVEGCAAYCDEPEHVSACIDFATENGLMDKREADRAKAFLALGVIEGPGGCSSEDECATYCDEIGHIRECLDFAALHDLMLDEDLEEAERVLAALEAGEALPGGCTNKGDCEAYCEDDGHLNECLAFALAAGFVTADEAEIARKTGGKGPGGCRRDECEAYCEDPAHGESCMRFALEHDILPPEELAEVEQILRALESGVAMPDCRGSQECDAYCTEPAHAEECLDFAVAAGFMDKEEAGRARHMMDAGLAEGPGGCRGVEKCEAYCIDPAHTKECLEFALQAGLISDEEFGHVMEMERFMKDAPLMMREHDEEGEQNEDGDGDPEHMMEDAMEEILQDDQGGIEFLEHMMQGGGDDGLPPPEVFILQ